MELRLPTGGRIEAAPRWERAIGGRAAGEESARLVVRITQPLARGAGWAVASAPVADAALAEEGNVLRVRGALMDVVSDVVTAYRAVMRAALQTDIERRSLAQAVASRKVVRALVATGRIARSDMAQSDADVAEREIGVVRSEAASDEAQAELAVLLGLEAGVKVRTTEPLEARTRPVDEDGEPRQSARDPHRISKRGDRGAPSRARTDGRRRRHAVGRGARGAGELCRGGHRGARRTARQPWRLSGCSRAEHPVSAGARPAGANGHGSPHESPTSGRREGSRPPGASSRSQSARRWSGCGRRPGACGSPARRSSLRGRRAGIEEGRLRRGLTSSYRMGRIRADLATAATRELNARIDYLNALTALERVEGTVFERWGITVEDDTARARMEATRRREENGAGADAHDAQAAADARMRPGEAARGGRSRRHPTTRGTAADARLMLRLEDAPGTPETAGLQPVIGGGEIPLR